MSTTPNHDLLEDPNNNNGAEDMSLFRGCTETCGWVAAVVAVLAFGSFGVPLKTNVQVEVHPLVMQSYKTATCFATCWLVLLAGEELRWSHWGIASGLFWVPGSTCGIFSIRNAGLAVAVGTWSSICVLTSFIFGILIFQEGVKNIGYTACAFALLMVGLIGMAQYSAVSSAASPSGGSSGSGKQSSAVPVHKTTNNTAAATMIPTDPTGTPPKPSSSARAAKNRSSSPFRGSKGTIKRTNSGDLDRSSSAHTKMVERSHSVKKTTMQPLEFEPLIDPTTMDDEDAVMHHRHEDRKKHDNFVFHLPAIGSIGQQQPLVLVLTRRQMGILGAVINGAWGGMNLIPLHYAMLYDGLSGAGYLISYATGSLLVNAVLWVLWAAYYYYYKGTWEETLQALPKFHLQHLFWPGFWAGLLYSMGNFASMLAVTYLGQGTGFSFCMMQLFVSGLWGVVYFKEIRGTETIVKWFASAGVAVTGIIWLSYEHDGESMGHR